MPIKLCLCLLLTIALHAETGYNAWLRYAPLEPAPTLPAVAAIAEASPLVSSAQQELIRGLRGMTGRTLRAQSGLPQESAIVLGTLPQLARLAPDWRLSATLAPEGYWLKTVAAGRYRYLVIAGADDRGVLYGAFALLRKIALGEPLAALDERESPYAPVRWVNQWDRLARHHRTRLRRATPSSGKTATCAPISAA